MPKVTYGGQSYECGELSVLECLTAQGVPVPSSCRSGLCETCMMKLVSGTVPEKAQTGLSETRAAQGYFLPCVCYPQRDISVALADKDSSNKQQAQVTRIENLNAYIMGIWLKPASAFEYKAGQYINFFKDETTARCYSLASVPALDDELFLNVRRVPNGQVSNWIFDNLKSGDSITISAALGDCFYLEGKPEQNILLIGTGSGLAPLYGIVREALRSKHQGKIVLYHGSYTREGFYLVAELQQLAKEHANFKYIPCVSGEAASPGYVAGLVHEVALHENSDLSNWRVFLCGHPEMVKAAQQQCFFAGASMREIFADPF